ncbi:hypothetical protein [Salinigranum sp.]|uniref:hypothetical protein n=1 Tax=Salinigranum sp. TaxID=1966351 RepID=UPI003562965A
MDDGVAVADANTLRVENARVDTTAYSVTAENVSTATVTDSRLTAGTAGAFHDVDAVRLRNVTGGRLVFDEGTRVEASNVTFTGKRAVGFSGRNVTVDEAVDPPRPPSSYTSVGPALTASNAGSNATLTVSLPVEAPPGTPNESLSVWRYDGNWSELRTTRDDGRIVATLSPDGDPVVVTALGASEPHLVTARSSDALSSTVGNETTLDVTVRNVGTEAYVLTNVTLRGPNASQFSVVADGLEPTPEATATPETTSTATPEATSTATSTRPTATASKRTSASPPGTLIPPGSSHRVTVVFAPDSATTQRATLVFDRATHADDATVTLAGTAAASATSVADGPGGGDSPHEDDCDVDDSEVVTDDRGRRLIRVSDNLYCVLNPRLPAQSRARPPKTATPSSPPVADVPTVTTTPTETSPERSTTVRASPTAATSPTDVSGPRRTTLATTTAPPTPTTPVTTPGFGAVPAVAAFGALVLAVRCGRCGR